MRMHKYHRKIDAIVVLYKLLFFLNNNKNGGTCSTDTTCFGTFIRNEITANIHKKIETYYRMKCANKVVVKLYLTQKTIDQANLRKTQIERRQTETFT